MKRSNRSVICMGCWIRSNQIKLNRRYRRERDRVCNKVARRILKVYLLFFPLPLQKPAGSRSVKGSVSRVYFFSRSLLIFLFRNVFLPLSLFLSPLLRPSFSNSQTSLAYSAKFGQIEQLIKSQYVMINRRDVSVNVGRRKRIVFKRNSRRSRWRSHARRSLCGK